jgi:acid stress chaperone HdeB
MKSATKLAALAILGLLAPCCAVADDEPLDVSKMRCNEFNAVINDEDSSGSSYMIAWLDGYLSGISGDTTINVTFIEQFSTKLIEACDKAPKRNVLEVAKQIGLAGGG